MVYGDRLANDALTLIRVLYLLNEQYVRSATNKGVCGYIYVHKAREKQCLLFFYRMD